MAQITIKQLEHFLNTLPEGREYVYAEIGRYKPYSKVTINAAIRRGYRAVRKTYDGSVYFVYPKSNKE